MTWCLNILATACMSIFQGSQTFQKVINLTKFLIISSGIFTRPIYHTDKDKPYPHPLHNYLQTAPIICLPAYIQGCNITRSTCCVPLSCRYIYIYIIDKYLHTAASSSCLASCENMHHQSNRIKLSQTKPLPP